jgi:hypothetical protein
MTAPPTAIGALKHKATVALGKIDFQKRVSISNLLGFSGLPLYVMSAHGGSKIAPRKIPRGVCHDGFALAEP